jgi:hypothetical protein
MAKEKYKLRYSHNTHLIFLTDSIILSYREMGYILLFSVENQAQQAKDKLNLTEMNVFLHHDHYW